MEKELNALVVADDSGIVGELTGKVSAPYTSLPMESESDRKKVYNVTSNPTYRLRDYVGKIINLKDVYAEQIELANDETGEINVAPRIILIDDKGVSYASVSKGVFSSLKKIFALFGTPDQWAKPLKVEVKQVSSKEKVTLTLTLVD